MSSDDFWPRLKSGVHWFRYRQSSDTGQIYIGLPSHGILLPYSPLLLRALDLLEHEQAVHSCLEIADRLQDPLFLRLLLHQLLKNSLLEIRTSLQPILKSLSGIQRESYLARVKAEVALASWRSPVDSLNVDRINVDRINVDRINVDPINMDPINEVLLRSSFPILIFGRNRLSKNLLLLLQASGFTRTQIINRTTAAPEMDAGVGLGELCGISVTQADLGKSFAELHRTIIQRSALSATGQESGVGVAAEAKISTPALIIAAQSVSWDLLDRWANDGTPYLQVADIEGPHISIGPLVIPGRSPCVRCLSITRAKKNPHLGAHAMVRSFIEPPEIPVSAIAYIAGLLSLEISTFALTGASNLLERTITINLHNPSEVISRFWTIESECGCA